MFASNEIINVKFPVKCLSNRQTIPYYHGYRLFGALLEKWPEIHGQEANWIQINRITGTYQENNYNGELLVDKDSSLLLRMPANKLKDCLVLANKQLILSDEYQSSIIQLGKPLVSPITPIKNLYSWCVSFKIHCDGHYKDKAGKKRSKDLFTWKITKDEFTIALHRKLFQNEIIFRANSLQILDDRHIFYIKENQLCGYPVVLSNLSEQDSVKIQANGIGGRRHMGCGFFIPLST